MRKTNWILSFILAASCISLTAHAKLYKWVDKNGVTHYGETVPPEYADAEKQTLKKSGLYETKPVAPDEKAIKAREDAERKLKIEKEAEMEQKRRNQTLLNTYSNEAEIDQARDRSLVLINARIDSNRTLMKSAQESLADFQKEAEARTKAGKKILPSLANDITQTEARVTKYKDELARGEKELEEVKARFDKDKETFRRIKNLPK